jgi:colanic acid/amylovoran biosynthesis protein
MKNKVLIVQNYNINKGDTSVIFAMRNSINRMYPDLELSLTSYDPDKAIKEYEIDSAEWLIDYRNIKNAKGVLLKVVHLFKELLWVVYSYFWILTYRKVGKTNRYLPQRKLKTINLYISADVIVLPGGHFFTTLNRFPVLFSHYYAMWFAKKMGKKTMIYAQTIGPFEGNWASVARRLTNSVIKFCDVVAVREEDSLKYDINNKMVVTAESVFSNVSLNNNKRALGFFENEHLNVGITIHHIYYARFFSRDEYIKKMSFILNNIIDSYNCNVLFIPMENFRSGDPGDRIMINDIIKELNNKSRVRIVEGDLSSKETEQIIASVDIFIGTKTHSIVYGLKNAVPTIAIAYQEKSNQFMKSFGVLENAINLEGFNEYEFLDIFKRVKSNLKHYSKKEQEALKDIVAMAERNNELLYELIKR